MISGHRLDVQDVLILRRPATARDDVHGRTSVATTRDGVSDWRKIEQRPLSHFPVLHGTWASMPGAGAVAEMAKSTTPGMEEVELRREQPSSAAGVTGKNDGINQRFLNISYTLLSL